ncbi:MAG: WGxxGxxG family protein [Mycobacterium sp.]|uniref:WGxxGxxG family protein n=1 Tax=Mycobacterium sp. TaxID=1785 RepID=UPI003BB4A2F9
MRKTVAVISATGALLFGGAGIANATIQGAAAPASTSTTLADNSNANTDQHSDDTGKWGLLGLLGLFGLAGLKRRNKTDGSVGVVPTAASGRV